MKLIYRDVTENENSDKTDTPCIKSNQIKLGCNFLNETYAYWLNNDFISQHGLFKVQLTFSNVHSILLSFSKKIKKK